MSEKVLLTEEDIRRALSRIAHEVVEHNRGCQDLVFIGLRTRGVPLARRLAQLIEDYEGCSVPVGRPGEGGRMQLIIKGKNTEVPEAARLYAERKIGRLGRYLNSATEAVVEISRENTRGSGQRQVVQVTVTANNAVLRGEERAADLFTAIDAVADTMKRQAERYKGKLSRLHQRRRAEATSPAEEMALLAEPSSLERVVRVKRFAIKPMATEEALEHMELLGHDFFFFQNAETGQYNVLYRRRDGDYGLIEPEAP